MEKLYFSRGNIKANNFRTVKPYLKLKNNKLNSMLTSITSPYDRLSAADFVESASNNIFLNNSRKLLLGLLKK
jgi:hypothetical protein